MFPYTALNNTGNECRANSIALAYVGKVSGTRNLSDMYNLLRCKFRHVVLFAGKVASLFSCIGVIFGISAKKQMVWIDAGRVIAMVTKAHTFWYLTAIKKPSRMCRAKIMPLVWISANYSVPIFVSLPKPYPAVRYRFLDILIESLLQGLLDTFTAAKLLWAAMQILSYGVKLSATA